MARDKDKMLNDYYYRVLELADNCREIDEVEFDKDEIREIAWNIVHDLYVEALEVRITKTEKPE